MVRDCSISAALASSKGFNARARSIHSRLALGEIESRMSAACRFTDLSTLQMCQFSRRVIPGRRSEAEAEPGIHPSRRSLRSLLRMRGPHAGERTKVRVSKHGFRVLGLRPRPGMTETY